MSYMSNKAPGRASVTETIVDDIHSDKVTAASNQEKVKPASLDAGKSTPSVGVSGRYSEGNLVRFQGNTKDTGKLGVSSAVALASSRTVKPAVENPDGERNLPGSY